MAAAMEVSYIPSVDDLVAFNAYVAGGTSVIRRRVLTMRLLGGVMVVLGVLLLIIWALVRDAFPLLVGIASVVLGLVYAIGARQLMLRATSKMARLMYQQEPTGVLFQPHTITVGPDGIHESTPVSSSNASWEAVTWVSEIEIAALLWISPVNAYIVPKRAFAGDAVFREFLAMAENYRSAAATPPHA